MARKKPKARTKAGPSPTHVRLIVSDEASPAISVQPGMKFDVVAVYLVDPNLGPVTPLAARLCGGTSTCLALVETGE